MMSSSGLVFSPAFLALAVATNAAFAQEPGYLDDRSTASALVKSLYNAVNRHEYARAWDYYGDAKPAKDFEAFVNGYAATERVDLKTGNVASEGAAGSTFYYLPVAILSVNTDGSEKVFAGCYTARSVNPQIQEPPFRPDAYRKRQPATRRNRVRGFGAGKLPGRAGARTGGWAAKAGASGFRCDAWRLRYAVAPARRRGTVLLLDPFPLQVGR